jgi:hypothetical protein
MHLIAAYSDLAIVRMIHEILSGEALGTAGTVD